MVTTEVLALVGGVASVGGGFFWLGKLQGRVSELSRQLGDYKENVEKAEEQTIERLDRLETEVSQLYRISNEQATILGRFDEKFETLFRGQDTLYKKIDSQTELIMSTLRPRNTQ